MAHALVTNQDELRRKLRRRGFAVTQATLSRDIHELRLSKGPGGYTLNNGPVAAVEDNSPPSVAEMMESFGMRVRQAMNQVVVGTAWAVGGCGLLLGGLGVANTMIMSVFTRIREIAILRVCGFSNTQIAAMIFGESAVVSLLGALLGMLTGTCLLFALKLVPALHGYVDVAIQPVVMLIVILLALLTGIAGALYPAFYAMRIRAVEALRFE